MIFLFFNQGDNGYEGNLLLSMGLLIDYLWCEIFVCLMFMCIVKDFVLFELGKVGSKDGCFVFFWFYQFCVVEWVVFDIEVNGIGKCYFIWYFVGLGKMKIIVWLSYCFIWYMNVEL